MPGKKDAVLYILQYLYRNTDDNHGVTNYEIMDFLRKKGIVLNERSILPNINTINECFEDSPYIDIQSFFEGGKKTYRLLSRPIEATEAEMIASALDTVKSFGKNDIINLKTKLYSLLSTYEFKEIIPALSTKTKKKDRTVGAGISWKLEVINRAIADGLMIRVIYDNKGELEERQISPYKLHTSVDGIYVLGKCSQHKTDISRFRVDRIAEINLEKTRAVPCANPQELYDMINLSKDMSFGERGTAVFVFTKQVERVVFDRYGKELTVHKLADGRMKISVEEYLSDTLLGWIFSLGNEIEVIGNRTLLNMMKERVAKWSKKLGAQ